MVFMLSIPLLVSPVSAWGLQTHENIASQVYYSLPVSVQHKLNLNEMKEGSIAPDVVFKDNTKHVYPASVAPAQLWLNRGKIAYMARNYNYASYCFGVASHYISDSYSAPHCVLGEADALHAAYEKQGLSMTPVVVYRPGESVKSLLSYGYRQGQIDWKLWLKNQNTGITRIDLNHAGSAAYTLIRNYI